MLVRLVRPVLPVWTGCWEPSTGLLGVMARPVGWVATVAPVARPGFSSAWAAWAVPGVLAVPGV
ncbi:hypothetical protein A5715_12365 [Mycolicibacter heraklionensis]|nr:hypothetical protein A5715_12365 [Mycolicibacter heraklionensis]